MISDIKDPVSPPEVADAIRKYIVDIEVNIHQDPAPEAKAITKTVNVCPVKKHKKAHKKAVVKACGESAKVVKK
jgi:hypothetical protein